MKRTFEEWYDLYQNNNMFAFNHDVEGLLWLKIRAITRKEQLRNFLTRNPDIKILSRKQTDIGKELYQTLSGLPDSMPRLDNFLRDKSQELYVSKGIDVKKLKNDLYKVTDYKWGGDQNNSLDRYLVSNFVKPISSYDSLKSKASIIGDNAWNYVQNSWYNNWSSFLIETIFENHPKVVSAVGEIKNVDFLSAISLLI